MSNQDFAALAVDELDRAETWANKDGVIDAETRNIFVSRFMQRAQVYALLSIAQEISKMPANMPEYVVNYRNDD